MRFFLFRSGDEGTAVELDWSAMGGEVLSVDDILAVMWRISHREPRERKQEIGQRVLPAILSAKLKLFRLFKYPRETNGCVYEDKHPSIVS